MAKTIEKSKIIGNLLAAFTVIVWGITFIASKKMLSVWTPAQVMFMRFAVGYVTLWVMYPKWERLIWREEAAYLLMGVFGCSLYFLCENTALTLTYTSNVSILVSAAPIFTALLAMRFSHADLPRRRLWIGFALALIGVALVVFNGSVQLHLSPAGDFMSLAAAVCWAIYTTLQERKLQIRSSLFVARKVAFYGLITVIPVMLLEGADFPLTPLFSSPLMVGCLLYLGVLGSGVCYAAWACAQSKLGAVHTNKYIFGVPFVTLAASVLLLGEPISAMGVCGSVLIVSGVAAAGSK